MRVLLAAEVAERHGHHRRDVVLLLLRADVGAQPAGVAAAAGRGPGLGVNPGAVLRGGRPGDAGSDFVHRRRRCLPPLRRRLVGRRLGVEGELGHAVGAYLRQRRLEGGAEPVPAHGLDQELHPVALPVLVVAALVEHADDRLGNAQQVLGRHEVHQHRRGAGHGGGAAPDVDPEPAPPVLQLRQPADVVDGELDVIAGAAFERDLELARQRRAQPVPQQEAGQRFRVGGHVEGLVGGDAGELAGGDVAHRVAARLAGGEAGVGEPPHRRLDVVQLDEVDLDVLAGGDVTEAARVALGDVGQHVELGRRQHALRDLHPDHLRVVELALAVGTADEAEDAPLFRRDLAAFELAEHVGELVDVRVGGERQPGPAVGGGIEDVLHGHWQVLRRAWSRRRRRSRPRRRDRGRRLRPPPPGVNGRPATRPMTIVPGSSARSAGTSTPGKCSSGPFHVHACGVAAPRITTAAGVSAGHPLATSRRARPARVAIDIISTTVTRSGGRASRAASQVARSAPVSTTAPAEMPRWVSGMPASAGAATADDTPGTTS